MSKRRRKGRADRRVERVATPAPRWLRYTALASLVSTLVLFVMIGRAEDAAAAETLVQAAIVMFAVTVILGGIVVMRRRE